MFIGKKFTDESFIEIIKAIKSHSYKFMKFDDANCLGVTETKSNTKTMILRHDVDMSPYGALKLGEMEAEYEVVSNFFFQLNAGTYQMLSPYCIDICKELQAMGHLVGLHVDSALFSEEEYKVKGTIDWIRSNLFPIDNVISFHRPQAKSLGRKYQSFVSAYDKAFFDTDVYASDSKGEDGFYEKLENFLTSEVPFFQLLLHPCWWENETDRRKIYKLASIRKQKELDDYMLANFPKVFGYVILNKRG